MSDPGIVPTLTTERLVLRPLVAPDVPALYEIFSDPEVMAYWSSPPLADMAAAEEFLEQTNRLIASGTFLKWGITRKDDDRVIGTCTLASVNVEHKRAEIGYALARRFWRNGYAAEAVPAVLRFSFQSLGLHRIEADVDPHNHASIRCLERLGFQKEGYARERYHLSGAVHDSVFYGLLRREYQSKDEG